MTAAGGRGTLVLVVGPSGVGKDTLIAYCRERLAEDDSVVFPQRIVTRQQRSASEDHAILTRPDFEAAVAAGGFVLHWEAHGLAYGIPASAADDLAAGRTVVVNVSRNVVEGARRRFRPLRVVAVAAPRDVLAARLGQRGRETTDEVGRRLGRQVGVDIVGDDVVTIDNSGPVEIAGEALMAVIAGARARQT